MNVTLAGPSHGSIIAAWNRKKSRSSFDMVVSFSHADGIIIMHGVVQRVAAEMQQFEHLVEASGVGRSRGADRERTGRSPGRLSLSSIASRARIQFWLPCTVLISPLWATNRYGWASGHDGNVLVENRGVHEQQRRLDARVGEVGEELR